MKSLFIILISSLPLLINAQSDFKILNKNEQVNTYPNIPRGEKVKFEPSSRLNSNQIFKLNSMTAMHLNYKDIKVVSWSKEGLPQFVTFGKRINLNSPLEVLNAFKRDMHISNPESEFKMISSFEDEIGMRHTKFQQTINDIEVYNGEVIIHEKNEKVVAINGNYFPTPELESFVPVLDQTEAEMQAKSLFNFEEIKPSILDQLDMVQIESKLVVYHKNKKLDSERLVWYVHIYPNLMDRYAVFVDAQNGKVIKHYKDLCSLHGEDLDHHFCEHGHDKLKTTTLFDPATANAQDLFNQFRSVNVFEINNTYYLLDASREMFNNVQSEMPNNPVGALWTLDGRMKNPANDDFEIYQIIDDNNSWAGNEVAISAHYNAGLAYEYFKSTHNRNSINGEGGNIISIINLSDEYGNQFDNAFWNGAAMFYGNGNFAFKDLPKAIDVAAHEMSHGVIQSSANLEYQDESGAINESFADIFGVLVDREDWKIAEDVATDYWPGRALRNLSDPHNGATFRDYNKGWQPKHMNERYIGSDDNGGVHRNSGIPNYAFYLHTTSNGMNKVKAERIYYRALTSYLTRSSNFLDLRNAVIQSASDLFGANSQEATSAALAFDQVGILNNGSGQGSDGEQDLEINNGRDLILHTNGVREGLEVSDENGADLSAGFSSSNPISKPTISDAGSEIMFVADDNNIHYMFFNSSTNTFEERIILDNIAGDGFWRNVALSRDGNRIAALSNNIDNKVYIFDFSGTTRRDQVYELYNPTFTAGVESGDVLYADVIEFDHSGQYLMYDALNSLNNANGENIEYWDISFVEVWNRSQNSFGQGTVGKLFNQLPESVSIGNPAFAENSPYIITYDLRQEDFLGFNYYLQAANIERSESKILFENVTLSYPSYSRLDNGVLFDANNTDGDPVLGFIPVSEDKISSNGDAFVFKQDASWGNWFSNGQRNLYVDTDDILMDHDLVAFPNPVQEIMNVKFTSTSTIQAQLKIINTNGQIVEKQTYSVRKGVNQFSLNVHDIPSGFYQLQLQLKEGLINLPFVKVHGDL